MPIALFFTPGTEGEPWLTVGLIAGALIAPVLVGFALRIRDRSGAEFASRPVSGREEALAAVLAIIPVLLLMEVSAVAALAALAAGVVGFWLVPRLRR